MLQALLQSIGTLNRHPVDNGISHHIDIVGRIGEDSATGMCNKRKAEPAAPCTDLPEDFGRQTAAVEQCTVGSPGDLTAIEGYDVASLR